MRVRKKPVEVEAWQLDCVALVSRTNIPEWVLAKYNAGDLEFIWHFNGIDWYIMTLEGTMGAHDGDYLIKGVWGELYPCKKEIFEETYDVIED